MSNTESAEFWLETIFEHTNIGTWKWNLQTGETQFFEPRKTILGYPAGDFAVTSVDTWLNLMHPSDVSKASGLLKRCQQDEGSTQSADVRLQHKSGPWKWYRFCGRLLRTDEKNANTWLVGTHQDITAEKNHELAHHEAKIQLNDLVKTLPALVYTLSFSTDKMQIFANDENLMGLGGTQGDPRHWWLDHVHPEDVAEQDERFQDWLAQGSSFTLIRKYRLRDSSGEYRWIVDATRAVSGPGLATDFVGSFYPLDADSMRQMRLEHLAEVVPGVLYEFEQFADGSSCFSYISEGARRMFGVDPEDLRESADVLFKHIHYDDIEHVRETIQKSAQTLHDWRCEYRIVSRKGTAWLSGYAVPRRTRSGSTVWSGMLVDITDQREYQDKLKLLASTDELTRVYNRRQFLIRLEELFASVQRGEQSACVIMFDLDYFKNVNDNYGHAMGDEVLRRTAEAVKNTLRRSDIVARIGGEEFAVLLPHTDAEAARISAEKIRKVIGELQFSNAQSSFNVTATLGVAAMLTGDVRADVVLKNADVAVYQGKNGGRNQVVMYRSDAENTNSN